MTVRIITRTRKFVEEYFYRHKCKSLYYHNLDHTLDVVASAEAIGKASELRADEIEIALVAAWCHDIGHNEEDWPHEEASVRITRGFLRSIDFPEKKVCEVAACIYATRIPQSPENIIQETLCDADMAHLAGDHYFETAERLRREMSEFTGREISPEAWLQENRRFFETHRYFTDYAKKNLQPLKERNKKELLARLNAAVH